MTILDKIKASAAPEAGATPAAKVATGKIVKPKAPKAPAPTALEPKVDAAPAKKATKEKAPKAPKAAPKADAAPRQARTGQRVLVAFRLPADVAAWLAGFPNKSLKAVELLSAAMEKAKAKAAK